VWNCRKGPLKYVPFIDDYIATQEQVVSLCHVMLPFELVLLVTDAAFHRLRAFPVAQPKVLQHCRGNAVFMMACDYSKQ